MIRFFIVSIFILMPSTFADEARDELIVQTVLKLKSFNYENSSDKVKGSITRYLNKNIGIGEYFTVIDKFSIRDQLSNLANLSIADNVNNEAVSLLVRLGGYEWISKLLKEKGESRMNFIRAIGTVNSKITVQVLSELVQGMSTSDANAASDALTKSALGQAELLNLLKRKKLPSSVVEKTLKVLATSADPEVRKMALEQNSENNGNKKSYNIASLVKVRGSVESGKTAYTKFCFTCHKAGDVGIDFGPALTEIGDKLAREAMYLSIIEPNQAISFGFEGYSVKTKTGLTLIGYITSESANELVMKVPGGVTVTTNKSDIISKVPINGSLMPEGLVASMSKQELVDLVEYLMTLKKRI